ncbi:MAG: RNA polymerase sigma factor [Chloroflexota bacterium]
MIGDSGTIEDLLRALAPQVLGTLTRRSGDFDAAEDAVQEALIAAADHWPREGLPESPRAWLLRTAGRRFVDQRRSEQARANRELQVWLDLPTAAGTAADEDDTLTVLYMCCHPSLTPASAIALTLRAVGGLTTAQIARAFLVPESTMGQRISRAKRTIRDSGATFRRPTDDERPVAIPSVLHVLYLMFNEGYVASDGTDLGRPQLADEAIRLARIVRQQIPDDPEVAGLLALMLLIEARRPARTKTDGEPIRLPDQDRSSWNHALIEEGMGILEAAIATGRVGEYQLQASIAAVHDAATTAEATDWPRILILYERLEEMTGNPVVTINRAVAAAMADGPCAGISILDSLDKSAASSHRVAAVRAHLLEMAGDTDGAIESYQVAARVTTNLAEQRHLSMQAARLRSQR